MMSEDRQQRGAIQLIRYAAYLPNPDLHSNAASSHPGFGNSPEEALRDALYWNNQQPWVVVRPASRWPRWVKVYDCEMSYREKDVWCVLCGQKSAAPIERRYAFAWVCSDCPYAVAFCKGSDLPHLLVMSINDSSSPEVQRVRQLFAAALGIKR